MSETKDLGHAGAGLGARALQRRTLPPYQIAVAATMLALTTAGGARADTILEWNQVLNEAITSEPVGPTVASRTMAMVNTAMFDAVNAIDMRYKSFAYMASGVSPTASKEAAAAQAAHDVLTALYPTRAAVFDGALAASLSPIGNSADKAAGLQIGMQAAAATIIARTADGSDVMMSHTQIDEPGHWRPMPPNFAPALTPKWGDVTPFTLSSGTQFRPAPPPSLSSAEYAAASEEVKIYGAKDSAVRTDDQTEMGIFWAYDVGTVGPPPVLYNQITAVIAQNQQNTLEENARLFALTNIAQADAGIATWEAKYFYDFWRPITGIRMADTDGNDATIADPDWEPLGAPGDGITEDFTPPFPAYTSGHAAFGAAAMAIIAEFYGTDEIAFTIGSDEYDGVLRPQVFRSFNRLSDAILENALSRMYLGIHWRFDADMGIDLGENVAKWVYANALTPLSEPAPMALLLTLLGVPYLGRRRI